MDANVSSSSGKNVAVSCAVRELPAEERRKKAFKSLGLFWGLALVTAPLPPIHWVTVPGFFIFGLVSFFRKRKEGQELQPFSFCCPECSAAVEVSARPFRPEAQLTCPGCRYLLRLRCAPVSLGAP